MRFRREEPFLLRDIFLQNVVLQCPTQPLRWNPPPLRHRQIHGEQNGRRTIDRHGRGDLIEWDAVEQSLHITEGRYCHAAPADLSARERIIRVEAHERRHVERHADTSLSVL